VPRTWGKTNRAREILDDAGISVEDPQNKIAINYDLHRHLHTSVGEGNYRVFINTAMELANTRANNDYQQHIMAMGRIASIDHDDIRKEFLKIRIRETLAGIGTELKIASDLMDTY